MSIKSLSVTVSHAVDLGCQNIQIKSDACARSGCMNGKNSKINHSPRGVGAHPMINLNAKFPGANQWTKLHAKACAFYLLQKKRDSRRRPSNCNDYCHAHACHYLSEAIDLGHLISFTNGRQSTVQAREIPGLR
jgi:hypothetical protein